MRIVQFKDGTYGIRKWSLLGFQFCSLYGFSFGDWERQPGECCKGDLKRVQVVWDYFNDKGEVIDEVRAMTIRLDALEETVRKRDTQATEAKKESSNKSGTGKQSCLLRPPP